jgi:hypothetical protein
MRFSIMVPCLTRLPPIDGEWRCVYLGDHDQFWTHGRLESPLVWELDTRRDGVPSHVEVDRELVTHWMDDPPSPFDVLIVEPVDVEPEPRLRLPR